MVTGPKLALPPTHRKLARRETVVAGDLIWTPRGWRDVTADDVGNVAQIYQAVARRRSEKVQAAASVRLPKFVRGGPG